MKLAKEQFVKYVNAFEKMSREENEILNVLDCNPEWKPSEWISQFYDFLSEMCELGEGTIEYGTDLDYFIWELDFGRDWKPGMVTEDGRDIDLSSAEKLYDYIMGESVD